uniref:Putative secreted protein n=1 Tax=Anopheles darlingi TaxID=43151 RepID=A0A2M4DRJ8_ANODA
MRWIASMVLLLRVLLMLWLLLLHPVSSSTNTVVRMHSAMSGICVTLAQVTTTSNTTSHGTRMTHRATHVMNELLLLLRVRVMLHRHHSTATVKIVRRATIIFNARWPLATWHCSTITIVDTFLLHCHHHTPVVRLFFPFQFPTVLSSVTCNANPLCRVATGSCVPSLVATSY